MAKRISTVDGQIEYGFTGIRDISNVLGMMEYGHKIRKISDILGMIEWNDESTDLIVQNSIHSQTSLSPLLAYTVVSVVASPRMTFDSFCAYNLEEVHIIAGDGQIFLYNVTDGYDNPIDLTSWNCSVSLTKYGYPYNLIVNIPGTITGGSSIGEFSIYFSNTISGSLSGVYMQQVILVDSVGATHIPSQGKIIIFPKGSYT